MSEITGGRPPGEPDASKISPLLGTNRVQSAVDGMALAADKVAGGLNKAAAALQKMSTAASRGTGPAGMGNGATLNGGRANGGGSTPVIGPRLGGGMPLGMASHQHQPTMTQRYGAPPPAAPAAGGAGVNPWAKRGAMLGGLWGAAAASRAMGDAQEYITTNTTAQLMGRGIPRNWDDIRTDIMRNNYTATSDTDAAAGALTARKSGFAVGSSGFNSLMTSGKNYRVMDPTATFAQAQARQTAFMGAAQGNYLLGRGIRTTEGGKSRDSMSVYNDVLNKAGFSGTHKYTADSKEAHWGATGNATNLIGAIAQQDPEMARGVEDLLRGSQTAQMKGFSRSDYMNAASTGNWDALQKMGISKTDLDRVKDNAALDRNLRDNKAEGFSDGLNASITALEQFKGALDKITDGPLGRALGFGSGMAGASGLAGTIGHVGASALGGYVGGKVLGSVLGGGTARGGLAAAGRGALGVAGGTAGIVGGAALSIGAAAVSATTSDQERARRKAQMMQHGASDSWWTDVNAWADAFNNDMTLGLSDRIGLGSSSNFEHLGPGGTGGEGGGGGAMSVSGVGGSSTNGVLPVGDARVSAPFGKYPKSGAPHYGKDFAVPMGTPVRAARGGRVYQAGWDNDGFGHHIRIDGGDGNYYIYGHLSKVSVRVGQTIKAGDVIGLSGDSGNSSGPHLHFEVRKGGKGRGNAVNPDPYLKGGAVGAGTAEEAGADPAAKGRNMLQGAGSPQGMPWGVNEADLISGALAGSASTSGPVAKRGTSPEGDAAEGSASIPSGGMSGVLSKAGFRGNGLNLAYAIMMAESRGNPKAHNQNRNTGDNSYGLFQINMLGGMGPERRKRWNLRNNDELFNPATNAKVAYDMSKGGTDWHDWSTYKSGSYKKYLGGQVKSYDVGSTNVDVDQVARVHKGEMIIDPVTADELRKALSTNSPTSIFGGKGGGKGITVGKIEIHTAHPFTDSAATDLGKQFLAIIGNHEQIQMIQEG